MSDTVGRNANQDVGMNANQEVGRNANQMVGRNTNVPLPYTSVDLLLPGRLWQSALDVEDVIVNVIESRERGEIAPDARVRVLLGVSAPLAPAVSNQVSDVKAHLEARAGASVRLAELSSDTLANQSVRIVDAHLESGFVRTEDGGRITNNIEVRSISRMWRLLWNDNLPLGETSASELLSAFEDNAARDRPLRR